jgi:hypothetical protein
MGSLDIGGVMDLESSPIAPFHTKIVTRLTVKIFKIVEQNL